MLWPRERLAAVLSQAGLSVTLPYLDDLARRWSESGEDRRSPLWREANDLAGHMLARWPRQDWYPRAETPSELGQMLAVGLSLMANPWAYSVMVATALSDVYLLYVFFKAQRMARRSEEDQAAQAREVPPRPNDSQPPKDAQPQGDPFGRLFTLPGWVIGGAGAAVLADAFL